MSFKRKLTTLMGISLIVLFGCAQPGVTVVPSPNYALVDNANGDRILPPPQKDQYDPKLYRDPDVPFVNDLNGYGEYIDRQVARLKARSGASVQITSATGECKSFTLPQRGPAPKFRPSSLSDEGQLLEETLMHVQALNDYYGSWSTLVDDAYSEYRKRCNL